MIHTLGTIALILLLIVGIGVLTGVICIGIIAGTGVTMVAVEKRKADKRRAELERRQNLRAGR